MALDTTPTNGGAEPPPAEEPPKASASAPAGGVELRERLDQMGTILAKGLDLAEAGVSLGATILSRVSIAASQRIREGLEAAAQQEGAAPGQPPPPPPEEAEAEPPYGLVNRLPLTPGGQARISFSVNNDSMTEVRRVEFMVQGFAGDSGKASIDAAAFAVKPAKKTIAPVDFEKFVLEGPAPADIPPDVYRGVIVVRSDKDLFIPVVLVVTPP